MADNSSQPQMPTPDPELPLDRLLEPVPDATALPVGSGGGHGADLGLLRTAGRDVHRLVQRGRSALQPRLASEPGSGRDGQRTVRHRRTPAGVTDAGHEVMTA